MNLQEQIVQALQVTYAGQDNSQVKNAQDYLKEISSDQDFLNNLIMISISPQQQSNFLKKDQIRIAATYYITTYIKEKAMGFDNQGKKQVLDKLIQMLSTDIIQLQKNVIQSGITSILHSDLTNSLKNNLITLFENNYEQYVYIIYRSILDSSQERYQKEFITKTHEHIIKSFQQYFQLLTQSQNEKQIKQVLETVYVLVNLMNSLVLKLQNNEKQRSKVFTLLIQNDTLIKTLYDFMNYPNNQIFLDQVNQCSQILTDIKLVIMKLMNRFMEQIEDYNDSAEQLNTLQIGEMFQHLNSFILQQLPQQIMKQSLEDMNLKNFIIEALQFVNYSCQFNKFYNVIQPHVKPLIVDVIFNFLLFADDDEDLMGENPLEYIYKCQDICEDQKSKTIQTTCAELLVTLCKYIDGTTSFVTNFSLALINKYSKSITQEQVVFLSEYQNQTILKKGDIFQIDLALFLLSIIQSAIHQRHDLVEQLDVYIFRHIKLLTSNETKLLIRQKFLLFLGYYLDIIFIYNQPFLQNLIQFILQNFNNNKEDLIFYQALETLEFVNILFQILTAEAQLSILQKSEHFNVQHILDALSNQIEGLTNQKQFDLLDKIIAQLPEKDPQVQPHVANTCIQLKNYFCKSQDNKDLCESILHSIQVLVLNFSEFYLQSFEPVLLDIYSLLPTFPESIIKLISLIIKKIKGVTIQIYNLYPSIKQHFFDQNCHIDYLFPLFNHLIIYGNLQENQQLFSDFLGLLLKGVMNPSSDFSASLSTLLLELFILQLGQYCNQEHWSPILQTLEKRRNGSLGVRGYLLVCITGAYLSIIGINGNILLDTGILNGTFIDNLLWNSDCDHYTRDFDVNLYIMTLGNLLQNYWSRPEICLKAHLILSGMSNILHHKWKLDQEKEKEIQESKIKKTRFKKKQVPISYEDVNQQFQEIIEQSAQKNDRISSEKLK